MIKPLSLADIHRLCETLDISHDKGDYNQANVSSMTLSRLTVLVNLALSRAVAASTLPTAWQYKVQDFPPNSPLEDLMDFMNNLTGADIVQVIWIDTISSSYIIYRLPII